MRTPLQNLARFALLALAILCVVHETTSFGPDPTSLTAPSAPGKELPAVAAAPAQAPPAHERGLSRTVPNRDIATPQGLALALDEVWVQEADGTQHAQQVHAASVTELEHQLTAEPVPGTRHAMPVLASEHAPDHRGSRRVVTPRVNVKLTPGADPAAIAATCGATSFDCPAFAPGFLILHTPGGLAPLRIAARAATLAGVESAVPDLARIHTPRAMPSDPLIPDQWHLKFDQQSGAVAEADLNVETAWAYPQDDAGSRGRGIRIGIVDDGLQATHPDLAANVDTTHDKDWNGNDADASPGSGNHHGTACAGNAAARGNNHLGGCGSAPEATLVGMRLIAGITSDAMEAEAMGYLPDLIDIKSNSWGPDDDGITLEEPGALTRAALENATTHGRGGKGTIFVWAAGNGRADQDNSNLDGYANSIHTIAIGAVDSQAGPTTYSEPGANLVAVAPSGAASPALGITTTDRTGTSGYNTAGDYYSDFSGTSSAAPTAAGVIALMLEANPGLGWRDVQEILIQTAHQVHPTDGDWTLNGAGFAFNHKFGAGLIDASAAVARARTWTNLAARVRTEVAQPAIHAAIPDHNAAGITRTFTVDPSADLRAEHVTVTVDITHAQRRNLRIVLTSPSGTSSVLAEPAPTLSSGAHFTDWTFMSVRHWGESAVGTWTLEVSDRVAGSTGTLDSATLAVHGTPAASYNHPPTLSAARLSHSGQPFWDEPITVAEVDAADSEGAPLAFEHQWQSTIDGSTWVDEPGATGASLQPDAAHAGRLWRCRVTASDGVSTTLPVWTAAIPLQSRPVTTARVGVPYASPTALYLTHPAAAPPDQPVPVILHEVSQGSNGGEWVEVLTLEETSLATYDLEDAQYNYLLFADSPIWHAIPAGTLVVVYNGTNRDPLLPPDDSDPSDGRMVVPSNHPTCFDPGTAWPLLGNSGDALRLNDAEGVTVSKLGYGLNTTTPNLGAVGSGRAAYYKGSSADGSTSATNWSTTTATIVHDGLTTSLDGVSPGRPNSTTNAIWIESLRHPAAAEPPRYRLGSTTVLPAGLALDPTSGLLSGTPSAGGAFPIVIERWLPTGETNAQAFTLTVVTDGPPDFEGWVSSFTGLADTRADGDPDHDGLANLVEYFSGLDPTTPDPSPARVIVREGPRLCLEYRRGKSITGVSGVVKASGNPAELGAWSSAEVGDELVADHPDHELRRASVPISAEAPRRFLRLEVSR